jgi:uncharacterized repeat protein (TIGR01451 family)
MRGMNRNLAVALVLLISLSFPTNSGAVDFTSPKTYPVGASPSAVIIGDFNGDGKPDIAVANSGSRNVSILLGNGDGTFLAAVNFDAGNSPSVLAVGDFNGDGKLDLAVFQAGNASNATAGAISILLGNGDGTFQTPKTTGLTVLASVMAVGDFNAGKKSDIVVENFDPTSQNSSLDLYAANGDGTFQPARQIAVPNLTFGNVAVADFNKDSKADLAVCTSAGVAILLGRGDGTFQQGPIIAVAAGFIPISVQTADLNLDGSPDIVALVDAHSSHCQDVCRSYDITHLSVFFSRGDGSFQSEVTVATAESSIVSGFRSQDIISDVAVGEFSGDGKVDLAYRRSTGGRSITRSALEVVLAKGDGSFSTTLVMNDPGPELVASDLDADKLSDLVAVGTSNNVSVLLNTSPTLGADMAIIQSGVSGVPGVSGPLGAGDNLTYTASVLNEGPQDATGVKFTDTLPTGVNFVSATSTIGNCVQSHGEVSCDFGALSDAADAQVTIVVASTVAGTITNSMNVTANEPDLASANNAAMQSSIVFPIYTLTVTKSGDGSGEVETSGGRSGVGIVCGSTCSATYLGGTQVSVGENPDPNSFLENWGGACSGSGSCSITMESDKILTAKFSLLNSSPDFTMNPSATSLTVNRGGQANDVLAFPAQGGFSGAIGLTCLVSGPSPRPSCGISPASVTPGTNATLTVNAPSLSTSLNATWFEPGAKLFTAGLPLGLLGCVLAAGCDKRRRRLWALYLLLMATIVPAACSGGSSGSQQQKLQTYTVTVMATSGAINHSTTIIVTVD